MTDANETHSQTDDSVSDHPPLDISCALACCPNCDHPVGVVLPADGSLVDSADRADGQESTLCPNCDTRFPVAYSLDAAE
jgi:hypothetical protein